MKSRIVLLTLVGVVTVASGCSAPVARQAGKLAADAYATRQDIKSAEATEETVAIASEDGSVQLTVPASWSTLPSTQ